MAIEAGFQAENEIAALFKLPLESFIGARNTLVAELKKRGLNEESARVKAFPRPPVPVWAINQLHWKRTAVMDHLIAAGDRFRQAQTARLTGGGPDLRAAFDERRDALAAAVSAATELLRAHGHTPTPDVLRRITTTLEALATLGTTLFAPPRGRLIAELAPQGFEALTALIPRDTGAPSRDAGAAAVVPFGPPGALRPGETKESAASRQKRDDAAARGTAARALREAERELAKAQTAARQAEMALKNAAERAKMATRAKAAVEREKATVDRRYDAAAGKADAALAIAHERARTAEAAADALQSAERAVAHARERAEQLS